MLTSIVWFAIKIQIVFKQVILKNISSHYLSLYKRGSTKGKKVSFQCFLFVIKISFIDGIQHNHDWSWKA